MRSLALFALAAPLAAAGALRGSEPIVTFVLAAVAVAAAARLLGEATEDVAVHAGPRLGGLVNAALGGAVPLALAALAVRAGLPDLAKASLVGAIVGHLLLLLGLAIFLGGLRNGDQYFDRTAAGLSATMMVLAVIALVVPALFGRLVADRNAGPVESLSEAVAAVMIAVYGLSLYYSLAWNPAEQAIAGVHRDRARTGVTRAALTLAGMLVAVLVLGRVLVDATAAGIARHGWSDLFVGAVVLPLVGGVAQHLGAVDLAWHNRMDLTTSITNGASLQVMLFVTPVLVFASLVVGRPMDLVFRQIELAALGAAVLVASLVAQDGESHWVEGVMLLALYLVLCLAFLWWPAGAP